MKRELIKLNGVCKDYGAGETAVHAIRDVDLEISEGEFVAIMGPSGSGKSTLMHLMGMLDRSTAGKYFFHGKDVATLSEKEFARFRGREIGFIFQAFNLLPRVSAQKNVELPMIYQNVGANKRREISRKILIEMGLKNRLKHKPNELSGGEKQRVAVARALANDAPIILADEPTGNLDSKKTKEIMEILVKLNKRGKTIVMVTHEPELSEYAKRLITMRDGHIVGDKPVTKALVQKLKKIVMRK